ncbi:Regulatory protein AtoC [uncultured bacterium]|nr:Regulatory protein AtoC [uncultured bacterium]
MPKPGLLILDSDETARGQMRWAFSRDYDVFEAATRAEAVQIAGDGQVPAGIVDLGLPPQPLKATEGMTAVREILSINPLFKAVVVTGLGEMDDALRAVDMGAFDFFTKPIAIEDVRLTIRRAVNTYRLQVESMGGQPGAAWPGELIGLCQPMQEVFSTVRKLAEVNIPVLIQGETGSGKETLARAVHRISSRPSMPFVKVACDSMPETILAGELFGEGQEETRPGAKGKIDLGDGGTLYLEEAGALSPALQKRLLGRLFGRSLDKTPPDGKACPDTRVIASSTRDMKSLVRAGEFSEELYNRLAIITFAVPPLRDRGEDVHMLSLYFLKKYSKELGRQVLGFAPGAVEAMAEYAWPGNVREMENRIRRAVSHIRKKEIAAEDLAIPAGPEAGNGPGSLTDTREAFRKRMIYEVLCRNFGNVTRTANELGISRQYLSRLIARFNIKISR